MKEATGELSTTVIVLIAIAFISTIIFSLRGEIANYIKNQWKAISGDEINLNIGE